MHDVIVVGGGFAGVTAARELAHAGRDVLLVEARDRLGGRTWQVDWLGERLELGGGYVHWHQPHVFAELTRAGHGVRQVPDADRVAWTVDGQRRLGSYAEREAIAERAWNRYVEGFASALPQPHLPLSVPDALLPLDGLSAAARLAELALGAEERDVLVAEIEGVLSGHLDDCSCLAVHRWHALSGGSLELTQAAGGGFALARGTGDLISAMSSQAAFSIEVGRRVTRVRRSEAAVDVEFVDGARVRARAVVVAVPLNVAGEIAFDPPLTATKRDAIASGQASRGCKIWIHARGHATMNALSPGHPLGYSATDRLLPDGTQLIVTFGADAERLDADDVDAVQAALDQLIPGYEVLATRAHDWLADDLARGTWAAHRPGWYAQYHAAMQEPEGRVVFAGSDLADGWCGFIDGAIESGLRAARLVRAAADG